MATAPTPSPQLSRVLGPWIATAIVIGTVIGSGVFKKPQAVADAIPFSGLVGLVWVLGGLLALLGALSLAEVSVLYPKAGGNYVFLREGYGRLAGFLWGWVEFWIIRGASLASTMGPGVRVEVNDLLTLSQVLLALQLPFAMFPLLHFTSSRKRMGGWRSGWFLLIAGWTTAVLITAMDLYGLPESLKAAWQVIVGR